MEAHRYGALRIVAYLTMREAMREQPRVHTIRPGGHGVCQPAKQNGGGSIDKTVACNKFADQVERDGVHVR